ncbi:MAG: nucleotide-binding protein [Acidobacteria bacterium]|nr:nucleotide-binding protein [Acidobacteriota bacterium]
MRSDRALVEMKALKEAAATAEVQRSSAAHDAWKAKVIVVMRQALGDQSTTLDRFTNLRYTVGLWTGAPVEAERDRRYFASQVTRAAALIDAAIYEVELMAEGQSVETQPVPGISPDTATVFLVHGHNGAAKHEVARFIERITGKPPVILDEQANQGRTLMEKFEAHANTAAYAIVLATPDDVGRIQGTDPATDQPRARQNVVFELGYFFGKLGRDRVAVLNNGVEKPSDVDGLAYISYPASNWQVELAKELHTAGVSVDMNRSL